MHMHMHMHMYMYMCIVVLSRPYADPLILSYLILIVNRALLENLKHVCPKDWT